MSASQSMISSMPHARQVGDLLKERAASLACDATLQAMINAMPEPIAILNQSRQIMAANHALLSAASAPNAAAVIGLRPGEVLGCVEFAKGHDGCGTAAACRVCGAGLCLSRIDAGDPGPVEHECQMTRRGKHGDEALEFNARASRLPSGWTIFTLHDVSDKKRRQVLEKCFFHDLLNSASAVKSLADFVATGSTQYHSLLSASADQLIDGIRHQQMLASAENGTLHVHREPVSPRQACLEVAELFNCSAQAEGRSIIVDVADKTATQISTDQVLLRRVLTNLVKNALEASPNHSRILMSVRSDQQRMWFSVTNPGEIPEALQFQIFHRSFSTKADRGRGIGTWSVRLLTERYLGGKASFLVGNGVTTFTIELPISAS